MLSLLKKKFSKITKHSRSSQDPENSLSGDQQPYNFFSVFANFWALLDSSGKSKLVYSKQKISYNKGKNFAITSEGKLFIADRKKASFHYI